LIDNNNNNYCLSIFFIVIVIIINNNKKHSHLHIFLNLLKPYWLLSDCAVFDHDLVYSNAFEDFSDTILSCYLAVHFLDMILSFRILLDCSFRRSNVCVASDTIHLIGDNRQKVSREFLWTLSKCSTLDVSDSCTLLLEAVDPTLDMTCRNFPFLVDCGSRRQEL
jgi:hypothetical protein